MKIKTCSFFLFTLFLFSAKEGVCQNINWGLKGGLSLPNLSSSGGSDVSNGYKTISGPDISIFADFPVTKNIFVESGLEWSTQGGQKSGLQTIPASPELAQYFPPGMNIQFLYANFTSTIRLQYLMLPVLLKNTIELGNVNRWHLYWDGGFFVALLITAHGSAAGTSKVYYDKEETNPVSSIPVLFDSTGNIKNQLHQGNLGIQGDVGISYKMNSISVFAEGGANYGFINLQKNTQNGINHTGALIFRIGISYEIPARGKM